MSSSEMSFDTMLRSWCTLRMQTQERLGSGAMFDRIAGKYDLLNSLMSGGMDRRWRRLLVRELGSLTNGDEVLDLATGTAEVALEIARAHPGVRVVGSDPSKEMLAVGRDKVAARGFAERVQLEPGDAQALPFEDARFAGCTMSFGIRNVPDRAKALREMARVVRPGGRVCILELTEPKRGPVAAVARLYLRAFVPILGSEYAYLQKSIAAFPEAGEFARMMTEAGLREVRLTKLGFGALYVYSGRL